MRIPTLAWFSTWCCLSIAALVTCVLILDIPESYAFRGEIPDKPGWWTQTLEEALNEAYDNGQIPGQYADRRRKCDFINTEAFDKIQMGMTYQQVEDILGCPAGAACRNDPAIAGMIGGPRRPAA